MKTRTFTMSIILSLVLLALVVSAVAAAPPLDLHMEALEVIGTNGEPFIASGSAVVAGLVCASGTTEEVNVVIANSGNGPYRILHVLKRFTCDDLSGTFDVQMVVKLNLATAATTARWKIVDGTGSYTNLKGQGSLVGIPQVPGTSILDIYDGKAH